MATLTENISATQKQIRVTGGESVPAGFRFRLEDEVLDLIKWERYPIADNGVRPPGWDHTRWVVARGASQSVPASHSAGTTLTAVVAASVSGESLVPPSPFVSGEQRIRLLGPFTVNHDTAGEDGTFANFAYTEIAPLPQGCLVLDAWAEPTVTFNVGTTSIMVGIGQSGDLTNTLTELSGGWRRQPDTKAPSSYVVTDISDADVSSGLNAKLVHARVVGADAALGCYINYDGETAPTAGQAHIYALIAEPVE